MQADVYEMVSDQPLRKIVKGMHVELSDGKWRKKSERRYTWIYTLKEPVVPGDILLVNTKRGTDFICVHKIDYISGCQFCSKYKKVRKHMNKHMEEGEAAGYER